MIKHDRHCESNNNLSKGLSNARTLATHEGAESKCVTWLAIGTFEKGTFRVKALRIEFLRFNPLILVVMESVHVQQKHVVFFNSKTSFKSHILRESALKTKYSGRLDAQHFIEALMHVIKVHHSLKIKIFDDIFFSFLDSGQNLCKQFFFDIRMNIKVHKQIGCCYLNSFKPSCEKRD